MIIIKQSTLDLISHDSKSSHDKIYFLNIVEEDELSITEVITEEFISEEAGVSTKNYLIYNGILYKPVKIKPTNISYT